MKRNVKGEKEKRKEERQETKKIVYIESHVLKAAFSLLKNIYRLITEIPTQTLLMISGSPVEGSYIHPDDLI